jgi:hypothetical protein
MCGSSVSMQDRISCDGCQIHHCYECTTKIRIAEIRCCHSDCHEESRFCLDCVIERTAEYLAKMSRKRVKRKFMAHEAPYSEDESKNHEESEDEQKNEEPGQDFNKKLGDVSIYDMSDEEEEESDH